VAIEWIKRKQGDYMKFRMIEECSDDESDEHQI
jgi:hypothetical protein